MPSLTYSAWRLRALFPCKYTTTARHETGGQAGRRAAFAAGHALLLEVAIAEALGGAA